MDKTTLSTTKLSRSFSAYDLLRSYKADTNNIQEQYTPPQYAMDNLSILCTKVLQSIVDFIEKKYPNGKLIVTSGYRCKRLNQMISGATKSQHLAGKAADLQCFIGNVMHNEEIVDAVKSMSLEFDQMIWEQGGKWVHISYNQQWNREQRLNL